MASKRALVAVHPEGSPAGNENGVPLSFTAYETTDAASTAGWRTESTRGTNAINPATRASTTSSDRAMLAPLPML